MKWNDEKGYITYKSALQNIKSILGISQIDYDLRCELAPYITYILDYISKRLILLGDDVDKKTLIQEVFDIFDYGADKIVSGATRDLLFDLGISDGDIYIENEEIPYNQDRFVFSWSNVLTALVVRLKFQYSNLLAQPIDNNCPCDCSRGQDTANYESWASGVYPEDESYSYYNYSDVNTGWRVSDDYPECTKCSRR